MIEPGALGKKVVFLYPPPVLTEVVEELARREFEVYLVRDHARLRQVLAGNPEALVFINLDDGLEEPEWEAYIKGLRADERTANVGIGLLTLNENKGLSEKYLMEIGAPCGFIVLKIGAAKTIEILAKTLEANEARGRRKFVRAVCAPGTAQVLVEVEGSNLRADVSDISVAGLALQFEGGHSFKAGTVLRNLSLTVKGSRILANGFVAAKRAGEDQATHVVMFDPNSLDDAKREKLRTLVFRVNQQSMDRLLGKN
ncbi:MAG: PilZ domain-containing protein [Spirochaetaceae bacterium]|nr:PilZ domain-containing protein [Spirochaetaceae bacterium]